MKIYLTALLTFISIIGVGQTSNKSDTIFTTSNERIICVINKVNDKEITFSYPQEAFDNVITTNQILKIHFSSGRVQTFNNRIEIQGEQDWEKVIITKNESDINGLVRKGEVKSSINTATWGTFSDMAKLTDKAYVKMKKQAAKMGAHIILCWSDQSEHRGNSAITGIAYGYK